MPATSADKSTANITAPFQRFFISKRIGAAGASVGISLSTRRGGVEGRLWAGAHEVKRKIWVCAHFFLLTVGGGPWHGAHMSLQTDLLAEIKAFLPERGITETTFGRLAVNDGKLVARLEEGASITIATLERVRTYIRDERARMEAA